MNNIARRDSPHKHLSPRFRSPLAALATSFALGIVWAHATHDILGICSFLVGALVCILIGLLLLRAGWGRTAVWFALTGLMFTGVAAARRWDQRFPRNHVRYLESMGLDLNDAVRLRGSVVSTPYRSGYGVQFDVEVQQVEFQGHTYAVTGKVRLHVQGSGAGGDPDVESLYDLRYGDVIRTTVRLRRPHVYQNPGRFDFRRWMEDIEDIYWVGTIKGFRQVQKLGHPGGFHLAETAEQMRQCLLRGIDDLYPPWSVQGRYGAVLKAVLWGDRTALDSDTIDDFRKTGLYHLLVIAGLHVGLLTLLVDSLLRAMRCRRVTRAFVVLGFLAVYAFLVEQRAPTLRATLMIALYLVARLLDREHSPLNAIGGVALVLLYIRPAWLFESGFQLSFAAALLIVSVAVPVLERATESYRRGLRRLDDVLLDDRFPPRIAQARLDLRALVQALRRRVAWFDRHPGLSRNLVVAPLRLLVWTANMLIFSAVLQLGLLLPMVETFHRVTFAGVGLNAIAIPVMTLLLAVALPVNLLSVVSPVLAAWPAKVLSLTMALLFDMTHLPGLAAWLSYRVPSPPLWVAWGFCASFVFAAWTLRHPPQSPEYGAEALAPGGAPQDMSKPLPGRVRGAAFGACAVFVVLVALHPFAPRLPHGVLQMTALDCGQGEAVFLLFPDGSTMLVDAGGSRTRPAREGGIQGRRWDPGEEIVSPFLWSFGIKKLNVVVVSDAREDHFGGLTAILDNFSVSEFWHPPHPETPEYAALLDAVGAHGIPTRTLMAGDLLSLGDGSIQILGPGPDPPSADATQQGGSLAMRISAAGGNLLLLGSPGSNAEKGILGSREPLQTTVLTLAPRGSNSLVSRRLVARVLPRVAILSTDADDAGSSSHPEAVELLRNQGARVFQTGIDGATTVDLKNGWFTVGSYALARTK